MTNEQLNDWLATDVMGWHIEEKEFDPKQICPFFWVDKKGNSLFRKTDWVPTKDLNQAVMCLKEFCTGLWTCKINYYGPLTKGHLILRKANGSNEVFLYFETIEKLAGCICKAIEEAHKAVKG